MCTHVLIMEQAPVCRHASSHVYLVLIVEHCVNWLQLSWGTAYIGLEDKAQLLHSSNYVQEVSRRHLDSMA